MITVVEFATQAHLLQALETIMAAFIVYYVDRGYITKIIGGAETLVGKNQLTGVDEPDNQTTEIWDDPKYSNIGTYFTISPSGDILEEVIPTFGTDNVNYRVTEREDSFLIPEEGRRFSNRFSSRFK